MKNLRLLWGYVCLVLLVFASCQKVVLDDVSGGEQVQDGVSVKFSVAKLEQLPFSTKRSSRATDVKSLCSKVSLAVYKDGTKINQVNQLATDGNFGEFQLVLSPGLYKIVVIAHNGLKNPTMTDMQKITFDGKVTDTFYYSGDFNIDKAATHSLELMRAVAMFRLVTTDKIPTGVSKMEFYYTGGSSTFDAIQGVGCVNSRQTEVREVTSDMAGKPGTFEVYTFTKADSNALDMRVTAYNETGVTVLSKEFTEVGIQRNMITQYTGEFFGDTAGESSPGALGLLIGSKEEWSLTNKTY